MKDLLKEIQKLMSPRGTPRRMLDPGLLVSPRATLYEVVGEAELVPIAQTCVGPNQPAGIRKSSGLEKRHLFWKGPTRLKFAGKARSGQLGQDVANLQIQTE